MGPSKARRGQVNSPVTLPWRGAEAEGFPCWRHPLYVSYWFGWLGASLVAQSVWPLIVAVVMGFVYFRTALMEERNFKSAELGDEYVRYSKRSKLLIPWVI